MGNVVLSDQFRRERPHLARLLEMTLTGLPPSARADLGVRLAAGQSSIRDVWVATGCEERFGALVLPADLEGDAGAGPVPLLSDACMPLAWHARHGLSVLCVALARLSDGQAVPMSARTLLPAAWCHWSSQSDTSSW